MENKVFHSELDSSFNIWVDGFEARFVQRSPDYFIVYLSSMKGCDQSCRMCHLTATGQTDSTPAYSRDFVKQFQAVIDELLRRKCFGILRDTPLIHINYMARGEPLLNRTLIEEFQRIHERMWDYYYEKTRKRVNLKPIISTIFPQAMHCGVGAREAFRTLNRLTETTWVPSIYYSLYSMNEGFRKKWLGKALDPERALVYLNYYDSITKGYHDVTNKIHFALIEGENDDYQTHKEIVKALGQDHLWSLHDIPLNLVRYNPVNEVHREAWDESYDVVASHYQQMGHPTKIIPKVGFDIKASCGMFLTPEEVT